MKKSLFLLTGFAWGVFLSNQSILYFALFISAITVIVEILVDEK